MTSPETGRRMGFYAVGNAPNGNLRIGMGTPDEKEFWILDITLTEASEFEVKAIKNLSPQNKNETPWEKTTLKILPQNAGGMARELAAQDSESITDLNG